MPRHHSLAALGLFLAVAAVGCRSQKPPPQMPTPKVTVTRPASAEVRDYWQYNGFLSPSETVEVRARVKGFLTKRLFREGAEVRGKETGEGTGQYKGDLLFEIDKREFLTAQAKAGAELAKADADIIKAKAEIENWEAQITLAKVELARAEEALNKNVAAKTDVDRAKATLAVNTAQREAAKAQHSAAEAARNSAASALRTSEIQLGYTDIYAPISGLIGRRVVDVGNLVGQDEPTLLTTIIRMDPVHAFFDVPERDLLQYIRDAERLGLPHPPKDPIPIDIRVAGEDGPWRQGAIDYVEGTLSAQTGTARVRAVAPNPYRGPSTDLRLFVPGTYVQVRVPKGLPAQRPAIPEDAIMTGQEGRFVYVVGANNVVEKRLVTLGATVWKAPPPAPGEVAPSWVLVNPNPVPPQQGPPPPTRRTVYSVVAITAGLKPDDRVIVDGLQKARPGAPVAPEEWNMTPPAPAK